VHLVEEPESELITQVEVRPANEYDADAALGLIERQQETSGLCPKNSCAMGHTARPTRVLISRNLEWRWWPNSGRWPTQSTSVMTISRWTFRPTMVSGT
jgi:hypothetical protein